MIAPPENDLSAIERAARVIAVVFIGAFAFLPVAEFAATDIVVWSYETDLANWLLGTAMIVSLAAGLASIPAVWSSLVPSLAASWSRIARARLLAPTLFALSAALYLLIALVVFDGAPIIVDELTHVRQADLFAHGRLWAPLDEVPEFFSNMQFIEDPRGRVFGQFPPGWSALMAIGMLFGAPWAISPLLCAGSVVALLALLRRSGSSPEFATGSAVLLAVNPWFAFGAGTQMNHLPTLFFVLLGAVAVAGVRAGSAHPTRDLFLAGLAYGAAFLIRPIEAVLFASVATLWILGGALTSLSAWRRAGVFLAGCVLTGVVLLVWNWAMNGDPLTLGYTVQWGPTHDLGFHDAPQGPPHTVARGAALVNKYLLWLQSVAFESPLPGLLLPLFAVAFWRQRSAVDSYLLASGLGVVLVYGAYWHDGGYLGPRFLLPIAPLLPIWMLRFPIAVAPSGSWRRRAASAVVALTIMAGLALAVPRRWQDYAEASPASRFGSKQAQAIADAAGVRDAIILVPTAWGSQIQPRVRALGISNADSWWLYERSDICRLEIATGIAEARLLRGDAAWRLLRPLASDSSRVVADTTSRGSIEYVVPGAAYPSYCRTKQVAAETGGFSLSRMQVDLSDSNLYARDLHERNPRLLAARPGRRVYVLRRDPVRFARLEPLNADSAYSEWNARLRAIGEEARRGMTATDAGGATGARVSKP